jgi:hypothetical protein
VSRVQEWINRIKIRCSVLVQGRELKIVRLMCSIQLGKCLTKRRYHFCLAALRITRWLQSALGQRGWRASKVSENASQSGSMLFRIIGFTLSRSYAFMTIWLRLSSLQPSLQPSSYVSGHLPVLMP